MIIALAICIGSLKLSIYTPRGPGPGFMSFGTGGILFLLSFHLFLKSLFSRTEGGAKDAYPKNIKTTSLILSALMFYALFLEKLGFILDSFLVFSFLFAISRTMKWYASIACSLSLALGSYVLFSVFLGIGLPRGMLNFFR
ncbi:MAG: tripartite tricarboxylate transporter TctB family protein [Candidatus Rokubacteria bacterium]|nr:tripartite tricarboxylate transporter TctB family protein [Candidatus Rokubacteria bacterium]